MISPEIDEMHLTEAVVLPSYAPAGGQPSATGSTSAGSSETASPAVSNAVTSALAQTIAQQPDGSANGFEIAAIASSDGSGVQIAWAVQLSQQVGDYDLLRV